MFEIKMPLEKDRIDQIQNDEGPEAALKECLKIIEYQIEVLAIVTQTVQMVETGITYEMCVTANTNVHKMLVGDKVYYI